MQEESMYPACRHLLASGCRCTQPAVSKSLYCRHHQVVKTKLAQIVPVPDPYGWDRKPLPLVVSEDRAALHVNYSIVIAAFNAGRIDIKTANCFNRLLRSCEINLTHGPLYDPATEPVRNIALTPEGEEIAPAAEDSDPEQASQSTNLVIPSEVEGPTNPAIPSATSEVEEPELSSTNLSTRPDRNQGPQRAGCSRDGVGSEVKGPALDPDDEKCKQLADKAREIFTQLGHGYEPSSGSGDEQEQHAHSSRTILQQEFLCNTPSSAPPCPSSSSPSIPTSPSSPRPASSPGWALPSR